MTAVFPKPETDPTVAGALAAHEADTTQVHGLPDTAAVLRTDAVVVAATAATPVLRSRVTGDTQDRFQMLADGTRKVGSGAVAPSVESVIQPSGDTSGAADLAAINASANVTLVRGATYYVNGPIVRASNSTFNARGATIHLVVGATNLLRNAAVAPTRTVTDAASTSNTTLTSATAAFTAADVGSAVGMVGGALGGATWYGTITAVANATTATISTSADVTTSGKRLDIFATRDSNISIEGGTFVVDVAPLDGHNAAATAFNTFASMFRRVDGLRIRDTRWQQAGATGQGGKFVVSLADVTDAVVHGTRFISTAGDGVHIMGPATNCVVTDTVGTTGDDMVVCSTGDQNTPLITDTQGSLTSIQVRGIVCTNSWSAFKFYDLGVTKKFPCSGIHVDDISGSTSQQMVAVINGTTDDLLIGRVTGTPGSGFPLVDVNTGQAIAQLTLRDLTWTSPNAASVGVVRLIQPRNGVRIENVSFGTAPSGTNIAVKIDTGSINGSGFGMTVLDIDGVYTPTQALGVAATYSTFHVLDIGGSGSGDSAILIRGVKVTATAGNLVNKRTVAPLSRVVVTQSDFTGSALFVSPAGDSKTTLTLHGVRAVCTNLVSVQSPLDLLMTSVQSVCSGAAVNVTGAGATPVRVIVGNTYKETGTGGAVTRSAAQAVSVSGIALPVDQTILTPSDGDMIYNSNATPANGVGAAIYNTAAAKWKNLYSGVTN